MNQSYLSFLANNIKSYLYRKKKAKMKFKNYKSQKDTFHKTSTIKNECYLYTYK